MSDNHLVDAKYVRQLADILAKNDLTEIFIEQDNLTLRIAKDAPDVTMVGAAPAAVAAAPAPVAAAPAAPAPVASAAADPAAEAGDDEPSGTKVTSPMVGTAYLAPEPGAAKFMNVGDKVTEGQTLLLVEAMKTFNPVSAHIAGTIKEILIDDAQPVEYGEPLVIIE